MKLARVAARIAALLLLPLSPAFAASGDNALPQCWTPQQLAARPEEKAARWTRRDTQMPPVDYLRPTPERTVGTVRRVKLPPGRKLVALTFDLCEAVNEVAGYDGGVVDFLRASNVKATFFAGGKWLLDHPERGAQLMADPRFEVGTHGWAHVNLHVVTGQAVMDEILGGMAAHDMTRAELARRSCVRDAGGATLTRLHRAPKLFRFPFGTCHAEALEAVAKSGQIAIQWDVVSGDPDRNATAQGLARGVVAGVKPGSIIVAHANGRGWETANALPMMVAELRRRGYEFVTVSELIAAGTPEIASSCYERHPGDNARYDRVQFRRDRASGRSSAPTTWPTVLEHR
jgi:peptidoglycan-N-acetylglucosamine deacetylase